MPVNNQTVHAVAAFPAGVFTVLRSDGCVLTNPAAGRYLVTVPAGFGAQAPNLKVTANAAPDAGPPVEPRFVNLVWLTQTTLEVQTFDPTGALADADGVWITVEIVPRVS